MHASNHEHFAYGTLCLLDIVVTTIMYIYITLGEMFPFGIQIGDLALCR